MLFLRGLEITRPKDCEYSYFPTIRLNALPVSKFVRQQWRREWSAVPYTSFLGTFATLLYSRKLKDLGERPALYAGQLCRAQPHYTESDRPLMEQAWNEERPPNATSVA